jgi:hypothetical protein
MVHVEAKVKVKVKVKTVSERVIIRGPVLLTEKGQLCHRVELEATGAKRSGTRVRQVAQQWRCYPPEARPGENFQERYHHMDFQVACLVQRDEHLHLTIRNSGYPMVRPIESLVR